MLRLAHSSQQLVHPHLSSEKCTVFLTPLCQFSYLGSHNLDLRRLHFLNSTAAHVLYCLFSKFTFILLICYSEDIICNQTFLLKVLKFRNQRVISTRELFELI